MVRVGDWRYRLPPKFPSGWQLPIRIVTYGAAKANGKNCGAAVGRGVDDGPDGGARS